MPFANNKGADQPAHPRSLSAFVVRCLDSIISVLAITEISRLLLVSVVEQAGLSLNWSQTPKTGFLMMRLKCDAWCNSSPEQQVLVLYEPRHEKTCLWGFRPGKTQTGLLSYRDQLESWNVGISECRLILSKQRTTKVLIRLICTFYCSHMAKTGFLMMWLILTQLCPAFHKRDIGKQCRHRLDAAFCHVASASDQGLHCLLTGITIQNREYQTPLNLEMGLSSW